MTKKEKEIEAWWRKIEAIEDADLQIGYRVTPRNPALFKATASKAKPPARKRPRAVRRRAKAACD